MSIETRSYLLTNKDVETLAAEIIDGHQSIERSRGTILKGMVALTIKELGAQQRKINTRAAQLDESGITAQLIAFEAIYAPIYEAVQRVAEHKFATVQGRGAIPGPFLLQAFKIGVFLSANSPPSNLRSPHARIHQASFWYRKGRHRLDCGRYQNKD